jgi:predicted CXXCH cytochrome family protein
MMGAAPAFADNGPHVSTSGNMAVDRCAGCHRAHTATNAYLLTQDETVLCESCHGSGATGASSDVMDGVGYAISGVNTRGASLGALRGGGFNFALIGSGSAVYSTTASLRSVPVGTSQASTSQHQIGVAGTAWGSGANGSGNGTAITLECTSCHDPHGNGNYRILRPVPTDGTALALPAPVAVTSVTQASATVSGTNTTYTYDVITAAANTFKVTQPVSFYGTTGGADGILAGTVTVVTDNQHFTVSIRNVGFASATGGTVGYADPAGIAAQTAFDATTATFKTWNVHGLVAGQKVVLSGFTPATYNGIFTVSAAATTTTFAISTTLNVAATVMGKISGVPDSKGTKVYTTTNYWAQDDHNYTGAYVASGTAPTAFIANISQWCTTCHTRLLAGSQSYKTASGDATFMYMHRSNNGKEGSPNCIQCHVAHGSNASMTGDGTTSYSSAVQTEFGINKVAPDSFLLRVDNRGTCNMCHNK